MKIHLLSGFLGSGKTTAIQQAAGMLIKRGVKTGVVTNDQGSRLVDGGLFKSLDMPNREVINGCFCCNFNDLDAGITSLSETDGTEVIFAESVGSCTDIVATVLKPLLQCRPGAQVTVSIFADVRLLQMVLQKEKNSFDDAVRYIYLKQLEEAGIIVINKVDLVDDGQLQALKNMMAAKYGDKTLLYQNSLNETDIRQWLLALDADESAADLLSLDIDYDVYATGEAKLAWVDQEVALFSSDNNAMQLAQDLVNKIYQQVCLQQYPIGHLKFLINNSIKISFTSPADPVIVLPPVQALFTSMLINMRVQVGPEILTQLIANAIKEMELQEGCKIITNSLSAFQPGYPRPAHRM